MRQFRFMVALVAAVLATLTPPFAYADEKPAGPPVVSAPAITPPPEKVFTPVAQIAKGYYKKADEAYDRGDYLTSLEWLKKSYSLSKRPALKYNIGRCYEKLWEGVSDKRSAEAIAFLENSIEGYSTYLLEASPKPVDASEITNKVDWLKARLKEAKAPLSPPAEVIKPPPAVVVQPPPPPTPPPSKKPPLYKKWWFWTAVGGVVAVGVVGMGIGLGVRAPQDQFPPEPSLGNVDLEILGRRW